MPENVQRGLIVLDPLTNNFGKRRVVIPHIKELILNLNGLIQSAAVLELDDSRADINRLLTGLQKSKTDVQEIMNALRTLKKQL